MKNLVVLPPLRASLVGARVPRRRAVDTDAIHSTIRDALSSAGLTVQGAATGDIATTIDRALSAAGLNMSASAPMDRVRATARPAFERRSGRPAAGSAHREDTSPGEFVSRSFTCHAGTRAYKLYIPAAYRLQSELRLPLLVMLHGCTQSADDFATGTRMNALAEQQGFLVAYPEQTANANGSRCWNWFRPGDQHRDGGEPAMIAGITHEIASAYHVDAQRIYVAGLSAGAAMAIVLGATYPELYAAVGAHSGLAYGAAHDVASAFAAMHSGAVSDSTVRYGENLIRQGVRTIPTIVFHGDSDKTVAAGNGKAILDQAIGALPDHTHLLVTAEEGSAAGRAYSKAVYAVGSDAPLFEHWLIRGGGHAWSGGSADGSFTDSSGPDASVEMIRFFKTHAR